MKTKNVVKIIQIAGYIGARTVVEFCYFLMVAPTIFFSLNLKESIKSGCSAIEEILPLLYQNLFSFIFLDNIWPKWPLCHVYVECCYCNALLHDRARQLKCFGNMCKKNSARSAKVKMTMTAHSPEIKGGRNGIFLGKPQLFLTAILHHVLRNCIFGFLPHIYFFHIVFGFLVPFSIWPFISLFYMDFYFPFLFGHFLFNSLSILF